MQRMSQDLLCQKNSKKKVLWRSHGINHYITPQPRTPAMKMSTLNSKKRWIKLGKNRKRRKNSIVNCK